MEKVGKFVGISGIALIAAMSFVSSTFAAEKTPEFRRLSTNEQISVAVKASGAEEMIADFSAGKGAFPDRGAYVTYISKGSAFSKLGIPVGSVLERDRRSCYLSHPLWVNMDPGSFGNDFDKIVWVDHSNRRKESVRPGDSDGCYIRGYRSLPNHHLRHGQRDPKWDAYVLTALHLQGKDTELAETCWAAAVAQGYRPDKLSAWSGMMIALDRREPKRAAAFAKGFAPFECSTEPGSFPIVLTDLYKLALITGDPRYLVNVGDGMLADESYSMHLPNFRKQADIASRVPEGTPPPSKLAEGMKLSSFLTKADTASVRWCENTEWGTRMHEWAAMAHLKTDRKSPRHTIDMPLDHYFVYYFSPSDKSRDLDVRVRFRITPKPAAPERKHAFDREFTFGLADRRDGEIPNFSPFMDARILLARITFGISDERYKPVWELGSHGVTKAPMLAFREGLGSKPSPLLVPTSSPYLPDPGRVHNLRIVRVGAQAEAILDAERLALVHVPEDLANPGLFLRVVGCKVELLSLTVDTLKSP